MLGLMATFFLAHGMQCAAADVHHSNTTLHMSTVDTGHSAAGLAPLPSDPWDGHAATVCFAVLAAVAALLCRAGVRGRLATVPELTHRLRVRIRGAPQRWFLTPLPLVLLSVSRT